MAILPEFDELDIDLEAEGEETEPEEETSTTWILNENNKTIGALSDNIEECVAQSAKCALRTERQEYEMYPIDYGSDLYLALGDTKPHVFAEIEYAVRECLAFDDRITAVENFAFDDHGGDVTVTFDMEIDTETIQMEEEVSIDG